MARVLEVNLEYRPFRDKEARLARAYELLAPLIEAPLAAAEELTQTKQEETDEAR